MGSGVAALFAAPGAYAKTKDMGPAAVSQTRNWLGLGWKDVQRLREPIR